ncbi:hypothetical protein GCM10010331_66960 [Streptomyces xanthochromogenes]|uniref:DUF397 domain-containing protein n=1 Tax=Streptomyces xanthochromogenes TaxID=67384 RepID=UPI001672618B|nr:DUF397 domain-containing protein [Streptomyces xanthochromogenes]GHB69600.1 hypothetical protein GCM10010331_66960 [Streptomyces xanthochromogenes]
MTIDRIIPKASALTGWRKSSHSGPDQGSCVEIADGHATVPVRDSKNPDGPALLFRAESFGTFIDALKARAF